MFHLQSVVLNIQVWDEHFVEVTTLGRIDALFVASSIDSQDMQFEPPDGLQTDFTRASGMMIIIIIKNFP